MERENIYTALIILLISVMVIGGCAMFGGGDYKFYNSRDNVEKDTPPYNPSYYRDQESRHMAVFFDIVDGLLIPSSRVAEIRPGRMPYRSETSGNIMIVYNGPDGRELGSYATEDPILARSCDFDDGNVGEIKIIEKGTIEVLLPFNRSIAEVEIGKVGEESKTFDFSVQIKKAIDIIFHNEP
ncbi:hypothetical protein ACFL5H_00795 [Candidatus Latescibacterota bacterium]